MHGGNLRIRAQTVKPELSFHMGGLLWPGLSALPWFLPAVLAPSPQLEGGSGEQTSSQPWEKPWSAQVYHGSSSRKVKRRR